ncbi:hypothetical protein HCN44_000597 [Aphidius gifuensis]|uniref:Uncharacterized protein n=1 Tax=Aphidius gifuensis TaxID=684658 RepID=A0A834XQN3_APHGI|nr:hypothetical protein HCN44_000597 [Aphidius gifuensis]
MQVDLDLSIPFISIPLSHSKDSDADVKPLVNINLKSIAFAAIFAGITAFIIPLFIQSPSENKYRVDDSFDPWEKIQSLNEFILGNNNVTPCVQRAICDAINRTKSSENKSSSVNEIIDGISKMKWIKKIIKGTSIEDAVEVGQRNDNQCMKIFDKCTISDELFQLIFDELGFN